VALKLEMSSETFLQVKNYRKLRKIFIFSPKQPKTPQKKIKKKNNFWIIFGNFGLIEKSEELKIVF